MKRIISLLLILLILCGCSGITLEKCLNNLNEFFMNYEYSDSNHGANNNTKYYSFYLPSDIQEMEYDDSYHHFVFYNSDFVMNLNINFILCDKVFSEDPDDPFATLSNYAIYEYDNLLNDTPEKYKFCLYKIEDKYFFSLYTNKLSFFGSTNINEIDELVKHLFILNNSAKMDYDMIIDAYYLGTTIDYSQPQLELFNNYIRPSGLLSDIVEQQEETDVQISGGEKAKETTTNND